MNCQNWWQRVSNKRYKEIAELVEVHFETVGKWVRSYREAGIQSLSSNARGRKQGDAQS